MPRSCVRGGADYPMLMHRQELPSLIAIIGRRNQSDEKGFYQVHIKALVYACGH